MSNRLALETSPYLRQHAENPVAWMPWGSEAFARAKSEGKPIFLSIGYSTCHWCHVMAHESFENEAIARLLNENFIPIKVDREERPDVDRVYMGFVQALTGQGGWPLSAWLTPELKPFYGGTYFPPEDRQGRNGFPSILKAIARGWKEDRQRLEEHGESLVESLGERRAQGKTAPDAEGGLAEPASTAFEAAFEQLQSSFDRERGGFGGAPKFPRSSNLDFLFRCAALQGLDTEAGREAVGMAAPTLRHMARGGIHDHVGGGFHRYSVDEDWFVPHFEKMLYDQAQIAVNALEAWQGSGDPRHVWLARDILDYVVRDMTHPQGGFYSAEDADSATGHGGEHAEGAFYVWTVGEIDEVLGKDTGFFCSVFNVLPEGNVAADRDPQGEFTGKNILAQGRPFAEAAAEFGLGIEDASALLVGCLERLREARSKRARPLRDEKVIAAWNGLMISAFAKAYGVLQAFAGSADSAANDPASAKADGEAAQGYLRAAVRAAEFVQRELYDAERGILFRTWKDARGPIEGFAEDYAFVIQGLLDLYEASFDLRWLRWAERLQNQMDALFWDSEAGGYFNSAAGAADIVIRLKEDYDGAEPAPSSVAAMNLLRLSAVFPPSVMTSSLANGKNAHAGQDYRRRALEALSGFQKRWSESPHALPRMLCALELALATPRQVVIAGDPASADFQALAAVLCERLGPRRSVLAADGGPGQKWLASRAPWIAEMAPLGGRPTAYVCEDYACQLPATSPEELRERLAFPAR